VSRLVGAPPGYVGYEEGGQLTEKVRKKPYAVILLDEIEKAHPDVYNLLLQILDDGQLTDSYGRKVNFKNTIIIMTSNLGAKDIKKGTSLGFGRDDLDSEYDRMDKMVREEVKKTFNPEFLNRLDDLVVFRTLERKDMTRIVDLLIGELESRLSGRDIKVQVTDPVRELIIEKGFDPQLGARPLRRSIQKLLEDPLADEILRGKIADNTVLKVGRKGEQLTFSSAPGAEKEKKDPEPAVATET
jgi:ATP-dependent Clp protease ATP-binding subunit ClpC